MSELELIRVNPGEEFIPFTNTPNIQGGEEYYQKIEINDHPPIKGVVSLRRKENLLMQPYAIILVEERVQLQAMEGNPLILWASLIFGGPAYDTDLTCVTVVDGKQLLGLHIPKKSFFRGIAEFSKWQEGQFPHRFYPVPDDPFVIDGIRLRFDLLSLN